jgi:hypothetical protein
LEATESAQAEGLSPSFIDLLCFRFGHGVAHHLGLVTSPAGDFVHCLRGHGVIQSTIDDPTYRNLLTHHFQLKLGFGASNNLREASEQEPLGVDAKRTNTNEQGRPLPYFAGIAKLGLDGAMPVPRRIPNPGCRYPATEPIRNCRRASFVGPQRLKRSRSNRLDLALPVLEVAFRPRPSAASAPNA